MKILTLNLWHGLAPTETTYFVELEPKVRRQLRERDQYQLISELKPDLLFLQEVNPLKKRSTEFSAVIDREVFGQHDLVGVKFAGLGWPWNMNSGLLTMVPSSLKPKQLESCKLSGHRLSEESGLLQWQWKETRYALLVEIEHAAWGRGLLVNCHLHHGIEFDSLMNHEVDQLLEQSVITENAAFDLKYRLRQGGRRREMELNSLFQRLSEIEDSYDFIILAGDFNFSPLSAEYKMVIGYGYKDLWKPESGEGWTFDETLNQGNHIFTSKFPLTVETEDLSFSPKIRQVILNLVQQQERKPRRIDYQFWKSKSFPNVIENSLVGVPLSEAVGISDHFGVLTELQ